MSKLRILFTHAYLLALDVKQAQWNKPYPPLMTIQAAALIRAAGFSVKLFDVLFEERPENITPVLSAYQPEVVVIFDDGFNYLTKMCLTNMREAAWKMIELAKRQGCKVIICSSDASDHYDKYLRKGADYVLLGEGEQTLLELIKILDQDLTAENLPGLAYLQDGLLIKTIKRPVLKDLDRLPLPAWDLIDFQAYRKRWEPNWGYFSLNLATTRGCPYKCNWCAKPIYGNSYKMRSPRHVVEEIAYLQKITSFDHIWFCDDIFGLKRSWVIAFAELVQEKKLKFRYKIQSRADLLVKDQYIEALKASGCDEVWMGVESGSQRILDAMDKGISIEQVRTACEKLKRLAIKPCFFIQFGYLTESSSDIKKTINLISELLPHDIGISVSYPLPGTKFFELVHQDLNTKANWTDSDDLDLMFKNTYPPDFYKKLHRFVHKKFRALHGAAKLRALSASFTAWNATDLKRALSLFYYAPAAYWAKRRLKSEYHEAARDL